MNKVYWIDDSTQSMFSVVDQVFPLLWDMECTCTTILFGNHYCKKQDENGPQQKDCEKFVDHINNRFTDYCLDMDDKRWESHGTNYQRKKALVKTTLLKLIPCAKSPEESESVEAVNGFERTHSEAITELAQLWMSDDEAQQLLMEIHEKKENLTTILNQRNMDVEGLIDAMGLLEKSFVALDLCLLYGDRSRTSNGWPTISMILFNELKARGHVCFLYSVMAVSQELIEQWKAVYRVLYPEDRGEFEIYSLKGLITKDKEAQDKVAIIQKINDMQRKG